MCSIRTCFPTNLGQAPSRDGMLNIHLVLDDSCTIKTLYTRSIMIFNPSYSFLSILYLSDLLTQHAEEKDRLKPKLSQTASITELYLNSLTRRILYDRKRLKAPIHPSLCQAPFQMIRIGPEQEDGPEDSWGPFQPELPYGWLLGTTVCIRL